MSILNLPKDVMALLALELNLPEILNFCVSNKKFNSAVCEKESFWYNKLVRDFPNFQKFLPAKKT